MYNPDNTPESGVSTLGQHPWSVGPTLESVVGTASFWPVNATLAEVDVGPVVGPTSYLSGQLPTWTHGYPKVGPPFTFATGEPVPPVRVHQPK